MNNLNDYRKDISIFLNLFDLHLEEGDIDQNSKLDVYDKNNKLVGCLTYDNDVRLFANIDGDRLDLFYEVPERMSCAYYDEDYNCHETHTSDFQMLFEKKDGNAITGLIQVEVTNDTKEGTKINVRPHIKTTVGDKKVTVNINRRGDLFYLREKDSHINRNNVEEIVVSPYGNYEGYLVHKIKIDDYEKYSGVIPKSKEEKYDLHIYQEEKFDGETNVLYDGYDRLVADLDEEASLVQEGELMKRIDVDMFDKIRLTRKAFNTETVNLFDNLVSTALHNYTGKEIHGLLGLEKKEPLIGEYDSLIDYYNDAPIKTKKLTN